MNAQQPPAQQSAVVPIDGDDIGGVVTSRFGPEAGVWVIAETTELGTRFAKMVVTDEVGRYVIPDLPKAKYKVWVRGYGLIDSPKVDSEPGKQLNLTAVIAPSLKDAAQYYPAIYWAAMIRVPDRGKFPGTGPNGNGIPTAFKTHDQYLNFVKTNGCGNLPPDRQLRDTIPKRSAVRFNRSPPGRRLQSGPAGTVDQQHRAAHDAGRPPRRAADGPTIRPANLSRRRRGRPASSATSSSRCATGRTPSTICTI